GSREAVVCAGYIVLERLGPLAAWEFLRAHEKEMEDPSGSDAIRKARSYWLALRSRVAGLFRDFDTAEAALALAEGLGPDDPKLCIPRCFLLELQDRHEEQVQAARRALDIAPEHADVAQVLAHALTLVGRDDEAVDLLQKTAQSTEDASVLAQLAM